MEILLAVLLSANSVLEVLVRMIKHWGLIFTNTHSRKTWKLAPCEISCYTVHALNNTSLQLTWSLCCKASSSAAKLQKLFFFRWFLTEASTPESNTKASWYTLGASECTRSPASVCKDKHNSSIQ